MTVSAMVVDVDLRQQQRSQSKFLLLAEAAADDGSTTVKRARRSHMRCSSLMRRFCCGFPMHTEALAKERQAAAMNEFP